MRWGNRQVRNKPVEISPAIIQRACSSWHVIWMGKFIVAVAAVKLLQSCLTLCDPIDGCPPGFPIPRILQARILEWVAISFSNAWKWSESEVTQSCLNLRDSMDCSLPVSSTVGFSRQEYWSGLPFFTASLQTNLQFLKESSLGELCSFAGYPSNDHLLPSPFCQMELEHPLWRILNLP